MRRPRPPVLPLRAFLLPMLRRVQHRRRRHGPHLVAGLRVRRVAGPALLLLPPRPRRAVVGGVAAGSPGTRGALLASPLGAGRRGGVVVAATRAMRGRSAVDVRRPALVHGRRGAEDAVWQRRHAGQLLDVTELLLHVLWRCQAQRHTHSSRHRHRHRHGVRCERAQRRRRQVGAPATPPAAFESTPPCWTAAPRWQHQRPPGPG